MKRQVEHPSLTSKAVKLRVVADYLSDTVHADSVAIGDQFRTAKNLFLHINSVTPQSDTLTIDSSLRDWQVVWESFGLLKVMMHATLCGVTSSRIPNEEIPSWPVHGLRQHLENERHALNRAGMARTVLGSVGIPKTPGIHTVRCMSLGVDAPLLDWMQVWSHYGVLDLLVASATGVGSIGASYFSQCEIDDIELLTSFRTLLFHPQHGRISRARYALSGYLNLGLGHDAFVYHPKSIESGTSIDAINWIFRNRFSQVRFSSGLSAFELIANVIGSPLQSMFKTGQTAIHVHGLRLEINADAQVVDSLGISHCETAGREESCWDVVPYKEFLNTTDDDLNRRRMAGVYPHTWLVSTHTELQQQSYDRADGLIGASTPPSNGSVLLRHCSVSEMIINTWLNSIAASLHLPLHSLKFRTAKTISPELNEPRYSLIASGSEYARVTRLPGESVSRPVSLFRLPLASIVSAKLQSGKPIGSTVDLHAADALRSTCFALRNCLVNYESDLANLAQWLMFDSLTGMEQQCLYRYQIAMTDCGLSLTPLPFWSLAGNDCLDSEYRREFNFTIGIDSDISTLIKSSLPSYAKAMGVDLGVLSQQKMHYTHEIESSCRVLLMQLDKNDPYHLVSSAKISRTAQVEEEFRIAKKVVLAAMNNINS